MEYFAIYLGVGIAAGFLAGLLGVGGGLIIVPALGLVFAAQHYPTAHIHHAALGTSLACIMLSAMASLREHHAHGAVNWAIVRALTPGIVLGTLIGALIAVAIPARPLKLFFALFVFYAATQLFLNIKPKPTRQLPASAGMWGVGGLIGAVSSLVGIGGGTLSVPFMLWCNVPGHHAIGTSAALGFPIALAGTVGYMAGGLSVSGLPEYSLGFIYLPALAGIALASVLTAPLGARAAHRLPVNTLKKGFAVFLYLIGARMALSLLS